MGEKRKRYYECLIVAGILYLALGSVWMALEVVIHGEVLPNKVDDIISIPIFISFYYNAKTLLDKHCGSIK